MKINLLLKRLSLKPEKLHTKNVQTLKFFQELDIENKYKPFVAISISQNHLNQVKYYKKLFFFVMNNIGIFVID